MRHPVRASTENLKKGDFSRRVVGMATRTDRKMPLIIAAVHGGSAVEGLVGVGRAHIVREGGLGTILALRIVRQHNLQADTQHALLHHHVPSSLVDENLQPTMRRSE